MADDQKQPTNQPSEKESEEKKTEETAQKEEKKLDPKLTKIIDQLGELSVLELAQLVKALEEKFGVEAVPVMSPAPTAGAPAAADSQPAAGGEEKTTFTVVLADAGANKINVIKALREIKPDLGLKEAKDMTEQTPAEVLVDAKKEEAEEAKKKLEEAGATVELK